MVGKRFVGRFVGKQKIGKRRDLGGKCLGSDQEADIAAQQCKDGTNCHGANLTVGLEYLLCHKGEKRRSLEGRD